MTNMDSLKNDLDNFDLNENDDNYDDCDENNRLTQPSLSYKERKIEHKLKKYEAILRNLENINRVTESSKFLFIGNCGLENNISREYVVEKFSKYGTIIDIIMQKKKSYSFVVYEDIKSTDVAINELQGKLIETNETQTPIVYYMFKVDKVPDLCELAENLLPEGLKYIENFIDDEYAKEIFDYIMNDHTQGFSDLKNRRVKHYGYEFRYGTNDVDETKPLEIKLPPVCDRLLDKCLQLKLISNKPDQLTVNLYEPGQGIPPHVDNINAFDDYIMSLSLLSSVVMEFRLKEACSKKPPSFRSLCLKPNSLLLLKEDARYKWSHSIAERKHDLIRLNQTSNEVTLIKRQLRMSLTFRKIITKKHLTAPNTAEAATTATIGESIQLPVNDEDAAHFESSFVHNVYNQIAEHFSSTRHSAWPGVVEFINQLPACSLILDAGCGNGKYLNIRNDILAFGCDYSVELVNICQKRNFNCFVSDCLNLPIADNFCDSVICIAVLHHLSTESRRIKAIKEITRILKIGGCALITVWAQEQKVNNQESYYIKNKKKSQQKDNENALRFDKNEMNSNEVNENKNINQVSEKSESNDQQPILHDYGKPFEKQDLFVKWNYKKMNEKKQKSNNNAESAEENVYLRFYHVFINGELENLFKDILNVQIKRSFYEQGNWCVVFEKISA